MFRTSPILATVTLVMTAQTAYASFDFSYTRVIASTQTGLDNDHNYIFDIQFPYFNNNHSAAFAPGFVTNTHVFQIQGPTGSTGLFRTTFDHLLQGAPASTLLSAMTFEFTSTSEVQIDYSISQSYSHVQGDDIRHTLFGSIRDFTDNVDLLDLEMRVFDEPHTGVQETQGSIIVEDGHHVRFSFGSEMFTWSGNPPLSGEARANGMLEVWITEIPEPSTVSLIGVGLLLLVRRRRFRESTTSRSRLDQA